MIKIKVLDKELTVAQAKELYQELHKLFGNSPFSWKDYRDDLDLFSRKEIKPKYDDTIYTPLKYCDEELTPPKDE